MQVKVTFRDEPGEGTGVARSFYSAVAEALLSMQHLPSDLGTVSEDGSLPNDDYGGDPSSSRRPPPSISPTRNFFSRFSKRSARQSGESKLIIITYTLIFYIFNFFLFLKHFI